MKWKAGLAAICQSKQRFNGGSDYRGIFSLCSLSNYMVEERNIRRRKGVILDSWGKERKKDILRERDRGTQREHGFTKFHIHDSLCALFDVDFCKILRQLGNTTNRAEHCKRLIGSGHSNTEFMKRGVQQDWSRKQQVREKERVGRWKVSRAVSTSRQYLAVQFSLSFSIESSSLSMALSLPSLILLLSITLSSSLDLALFPTTPVSNTHTSNRVSSITNWKWPQALREKRKALCECVCECVRVCLGG